jgi:NADPH-dependent glutamate synthase beta subunit-like oxidoreductase
MQPLWNDDMPYAAQFLERCRGNEPAHCQVACPLHIDNRRMAGLIAAGRFTEALQVIREHLPLPRVLGRICTRPCESACQRRNHDQPVAICDLKRFVADEVCLPPPVLPAVPERSERVAVVGGGPAGVMAAWELRKRGYPVTLFEAEQALGGAALLYIPRYRLPREVLEEEFNQVYQIGVEVLFGTRVGQDIGLGELRERYAAVLLALGAHASLSLRIPGEELPGVYSALDLLKRVNLGNPPSIGPRVAIIGGGDVAIDAARTCRRLGAEQVTLLYRRSVAEIPASPRELAEAEEEGVHFEYLVSPSRIIGTNQVQSIQCARMALGALDASGRQRPVLMPGQELHLPVDQVVVAIGQTVAAPAWMTAFRTSPRGGLEVDPISLQTSLPGVFAAGDLIYGADSAVTALAAGRHAAFGIDSFLRGRIPAELPREFAPWQTRLHMEVTDLPMQPSQPMPRLPTEGRTAGFEPIDLGYDAKSAQAEARRCLSCECSECVKHCKYLAQHCASPIELVHKFADLKAENRYIPYSCNLCGLCAEMCPEKLDTGRFALATRQELVVNSKAPLPVHRPVLTHQRLSRSRPFTLARTPVHTERCEQVFFPGCGLPADAPELVFDAYKYLLGRQPATGILLDCCGAPTRMLGNQAGFNSVRDEIVSAVHRLGTDKIVLACPDCYHTIKSHSPELEVTTLYEVMAKEGPPTPQVTQRGRVFSIHDACATRLESGLQDSVRELVTGLDCGIEELEYSRSKTRCCGSGGMAQCADPELFKAVTRSRTEESPRDLLTYCAGCRMTLASANKPSHHILELFFALRSSSDRARLPPGPARRWLNRLRVKWELRS